MSKKIYPKKSLGQNFLIDKNIVNKIINLIDFNRFDTIVEIGPGKGAITEYLYKNFKNIILIEIDNRLADNLKNLYTDLKVYNKNFLEWKPDFEIKNALIIGNLPYNVSTQIIFKVLSEYTLYKQAIFMLQKEVAQRVVAENKSKNFSLLSVISQCFSTPEINFHISANCFFPVPKVTSTIVTFNIANRFNIKDFYDFFLFIKAIFYGKRKKLINVLTTNPFIDFKEDFILFFKNNFSINTRINNLNINEIVNLYNVFKQV